MDFGRELSRLPRKHSITIPRDEGGYIGRECPADDCTCRYFKVTPETGIEGQDTRHCPYCGHVGDANEFATEAQMEYAKSVVLKRATEALLRDLKRAGARMSTRPTGPLGLGISVTVKGSPHPVFRYREQDLETEVECEGCQLRYAIYGVHAYCPDCGVHNSLQILDKSLDVVLRKLDVAASQDDPLKESLIANALGDVVAAFDAFGRETHSVASGISGAEGAGRPVNFQSLAPAREAVRKSLSLDFAEALSSEEWRLAVRVFQKRHLFAHRAGVVDEEYLRKSGDLEARVGRKARLSVCEIRKAVDLVRQMGRSFGGAVPDPSVAGGRAPDTGSGEE